MYSKAFKICGLTIQFEPDEPVTDIKEYSLFRVNKMKMPDIRVRVLREPLPKAPCDLVCSEDRRRRIVLNHIKHDYTFLPDPVIKEYVPYACAVHGKGSVDLFLDYKGALWDTMLFDALNFTDLFFEYGIGILHASFICINKKAVLFAGPKQIGKSTQADLWMKYKNASIINGDRAGIRIDRNGLTAFGLPFCGTSGICRNEQYPVTAIVFPQKSSINTLTRLSEVESFMQLIGCLSFMYSDMDAQNTALNFADQMATKCLCLRLDCRPDVQAVNLLSKELGLN